MKRLLLLIFLLFLSLSVSGCWYTGDYEKYADTMSTHSMAESDRISNQANAIMETVALTNTGTKTEATLLAVIGMMQIERLQFSPLNINAPTTGMDVWNSAVGFIPFMTMGFTTYKIAEKGFEAAGNIEMTAETIDTTDSFNKTEVHGTGEGNSVSAATAPPTVVYQ